ncbi:MAG: ATP synthase F1 subunit gamma [Lachnospiraceae bacterium]|nr:ATP synthase F1 subunit gamma [Lachnospiraceae bacterium]
MANIKELKNRIGSVRNTRKITNAMYLISSAKLRRAKEGLEKTRPYFEATEYEIQRIFQSRSDVDSRYFYPAEGRAPEAEVIALLLITADRGLAGAYNHNVIKLAEQELAKHPRVRLYVVGDYGRRYFKKHKRPIEQSFYYTAQEPSFARAREIAGKLLEEYESGRVDEIRVIYSDMISEFESEVRKVRLLPFSRRDFLEMSGEGEFAEQEFHFDPSPAKVLDTMIPSYVAGFIYGALVDSFCTEQNARMNAMSNANKNAEELLGELQIEYNRVRQAGITREITEVSAGAKAQKRKRKKSAEAQTEER